MYALTTALLLLSASALIVQAGSIPEASSKAVEETKTTNFTNNGFSLKTGYEGYIAAVDQEKSSKIDSFLKSDLLTKISLLKNGLIAAKSVLRPFALKIFFGAKFLSFVLLWGVIATNAVCKFTSLCSFSVNLPNINKEEIKERIVNMARPYLSDETLDYTLRFARSAIDSYNAVQEFA